MFKFIKRLKQRKYKKFIKGLHDELIFLSEPEHNLATKVRLLFSLVDTIVNNEDYIDINTVETRLFYLDFINISLPILSEYSVGSKVQVYPRFNNYPTPINRYSLYHNKLLIDLCVDMMVTKGHIDDDLEELKNVKGDR